MSKKALPSRNGELEHVTIEDLEHLEELVNKPDLKSFDLRQASTILRRLLIEGDLAMVATPFGKRIHLEEPDNKPIEKLSRQDQLIFWQSAGCTVHGVTFRSLMLNRGSKTLTLEGFDPDSTVSVKIDGFLRQNVFYLAGPYSEDGKPVSKFISRNDVLKYVAHKAAGAHFDYQRVGTDYLLDRIRSGIDLITEEGMPTFRVDMEAFQGPPPKFKRIEGRLDPVFVEVLAAAKFLIESPDVAELRKLICA